jgi:Xaa-Pro aminopeptidase
MNAPLPRYKAPFDTARLDTLLDNAGIDVLLATSKHNVQYLLGGYRSFFFEVIDAIGVSRYLPVFVYLKGKPDHSAFVGAGLDGYSVQLGEIWTPATQTRAYGSKDAIGYALAHLKSVGASARRIGVEVPFLPIDVAPVITDALPNSTLVDATFALERLRARKTPEELTFLREASERVVASMQAVFARATAGMTKAELVQALREEETQRELTFEYCLVTAGTNVNRAPSSQKLGDGDIVSLDSGGNYRGYVGDLCRMGILGEPDAELEALLGVVEEIQQAARRPLRAGALGSEIVTVGQRCVADSPHAAYLDFTAHGLGLITHEAPRLMPNAARYDDYDGKLPLEAGMAISIETTMHHPTRGFIKLEDTVTVTQDGCEGYGDAARSWNRMGG